MPRKTQPQTITTDPTQPELDGIPPIKTARPKKKKANPLILDYMDLQQLLSLVKTVHRLIDGYQYYDLFNKNGHWNGHNLAKTDRIIGAINAIKTALVIVERCYTITETVKKRYDFYNKYREIDELTGKEYQPIFNHDDAILRVNELSGKLDGFIHILDRYGHDIDLQHIIHTVIYQDCLNHVKSIQKDLSEKLQRIEKDPTLLTNPILDPWGIGAKDRDNTWSAKWAE